MPRRLVATTALAALSLALVGGAAAAPAFADTVPVVGTTACNTAVAANATVTADLGVLQTARNTLATVQNTTTSTDADIAQAQTAVDTAKSAYAAAVIRATALLCTTSSTSSTTPAPTTTPAPPVGVRHRPTPVTESVADIDAATNALSCTSTNADLLAIDKAIAARQAAHQDVGDTETRLAAKVADLSCTSGAVTSKAAAQTAKDCGCDTATTTEAPATTDTTVVTYKTVNPTQDDGSTPTLSGSEVTQAPEGSAQTGAN